LASAGTSAASPDPFNGHIDEFRIAHVQHSDGWIKTTWNNMSDLGLFAAVGTEEQEGGQPPPLAGAGLVVCLMPRGSGVREKQHVRHYLDGVPTDITVVTAARSWAICRWDGSSSETGVRTKRTCLPSARPLGRRHGRTLER
jgi:hypothetical protein